MYNYICVYIQIYEFLWLCSHIYTCFFFVCKSLHIIETCLCCFLDMQLYSNNLSTIALISPLIILELMPACSSCSNNVYLLHNLSGSDGKNNVFEIPEAELIKTGDLGTLIRVLFRVDLLPWAFTSNYISFAKSYNNFLSAKLARSTL